MRSWSLPIKRFWAWPTELKRHGVLGINHRNACFVLPGNRREYYPRVDNKLQTKKICEAHGIPVPQTFGVIQRQGDIHRFRDLIGRRSQFVVKPAEGSEGRGIVVVKARQGNLLITAGERRLSLGEIGYHLSAVLAGLYTLSGQPDAAIVEQRIAPHPLFHNVVPCGTPDIRVILYRGIPAMAMTRLPTRASSGRANLHQGAVGAGIDLATGIARQGVCKSRVVDTHPDTGQRLTGLHITHWPQLLRAAIRLADCLELAYVGIDFVLDAESGPMVLEANARPGLGIQLATHSGLVPRLHWIDTHHAPGMSVSERMRIVVDLETGPATDTCVHDTVEAEVESTRNVVAGPTT